MMRETPPLCGLARPRVAVTDDNGPGVAVAVGRIYASDDVAMVYFGRFG